MKTFTLALTSIAVLSLTACSTFSKSPEEALFAGIDSSKITPVAATVAGSDGSDKVSFGSGSIFGGVGEQSAASKLAESQIRASASNPTCAQFNVNALAFAAKPETPGFGMGLLKTIALGTVAGFASGGVSALGIGSSFLESTAIGTANQVVFNAANPLVDKVIPDGTIGGSDKELAIKAAAERVGCSNPSWASTLSPLEAAALSSKLNKESKAAQKAAGNVVVSTPSVSAPSLTTPAVTAPSVTTPVPSQALPVVCPAGTTAQPGGSCLVTGNYSGG